MYTVLTDGMGTMTLSLAVSRLDTLDDIYRRSSRATFTDPLRQGHLIIRTPRLVFPVAGRYQFRLLADDELVTQAVLDVTVKE